MSNFELDANVKDNFTPTINRWKEGLSGVDEAVKDLNRSVDNQSAAMSSQAAAIAKTTAALREASNAEDDAKKKKAASRDETEKLSDALAESIMRLRAQRDLLNDPVFSKNLKYQSELKAEVDKLTDSITSSGKATDKQSLSMTDMVAGFYMARQAASVLAGGVMAIVDAAKQYDSVRTRLTATEGSPLVAEDDLKRLHELAKLPGLGFGEAAQAMASLRSLHVSARDTFALIDGIARGNASMGGGAEQFGRVMYQIQQSVGKTKVSMEDLRPVMEAIPNIGSMIAEKFGSIDSDAINKKLESMGKTSKDFWMDIAEMASNLPPAGDTIANNLDNIGDAWTRIKASMADTQAIKEATGAIAEFLNASADAKEKSDSLESYRQRALKNLDLGTGGESTVVGMGVAVAGQTPTEDVEKQIAEEISRLQRMDAVELDYQKRKNENADALARSDAERRRKWAEADKKEEERKKKAHDAAIAEAKRVQAEILRLQQDADRQFTSATGLSYGAYSVAHPGGVDREDETPSLTTGMQKGRADEAKRREELQKKIKALDEKILAQEERMANARAHLAEKVAESQRKSAEEQIRVQREIAQAGERTFMTLATVAELSASKQSAAYKGLFLVAKGFAIADASIQIADGIAKSANLPFPANVAAMATTAALTAGIVADIQAVTMRANGGPMFGSGVVGERGREWLTPIVPSVITPSHKTTTNNYGGVTVIVKGAVDSRTLRNIREAVTDRRQSPR